MDRRKTTCRRRRARAGFTLMEVLLVMAILVVLASLVVMNFDSILGGVSEDATQSQIKVLDTACKKYKMDMKVPPQTLDNLLEDPGDADSGGRSRWRGPYLEGEIPMDQWDRPFELTTDANGKIVISSAGPDGTSGNEDDITN
ncbi:MAG: type II secretion system protein GspG [Pirellulales bacterium]|nr:type II secretion system protein GspG [Pirellulales bacterium]